MKKTLLKLSTLALAFSVVATAQDSASCPDLYLRISRPHTDEISQRASLKVDALAEEFKVLAKRNSKQMTVSSYGAINGEEFLKVRIKPLNPQKPIRVAIVAGIHGNEVLGPISALRFVRGLVTDKRLANRVDLTLYPMANPRALRQGQRRLNNHAELDLNRDFRPESKSPEVTALIRELEGQSFDIALDLHGAPTKLHFFAIGAAEDKGLARLALEKLPKEILLESNTKAYPGPAGIPSDPDRYTLEARGVARSELPNTVKTHFYEALKTPYVYTLEYPGRMNPEDAVNYNEEMIRKFLETLLERQDPNLKP